MRWVRRLIIIGLGLILIIDGLIMSPFPVVQFVVGLIMIGLVPVDVLVDRLVPNPADEVDIEHLQEIQERYKKLHPDEPDL